MWWGPAALLMALIWWLSSGARTPGPPLPHPWDWAAHFVAYLALGYALGRATGRRDVAWVLAAWFGALDEVHQAFVPPREAGVVDWVFDLLGALVGSRLALPKPPLAPTNLTFELNFEDEELAAEPSRAIHEKAVNS